MTPRFYDVFALSQSAFISDAALRREFSDGQVLILDDPHEPQAPDFSRR